MSYRVFISHTEADRKISEEIGRVINNAFEGDIVPYFAFREIKSGDKWKNEIKKFLEECNAIISIVTKNSINKPWLFIEWSAYWIANKKFYILISDEVKLTDLVHPMQDTQVTTMSDIDSVKGLFSRLSEDIGRKYIPFDKAEDFVFSIKSALIEQEREQAEKNYLKYKDKFEILPTDDNEIEKIALFFYSRNEYDQFKKISVQIKSDTIKSNIAFKLLRENDYDNAFHIAQQIRSAQSQAGIVIDLIDNGFDDSKYVRNLIDEISMKSSAHLRQICFHLAEEGREDSGVFRNIVDLMTSMSELRKIAVYFVENNRCDNEVFSEVIDKLAKNNGAELRKVGSALIHQKKQDLDIFKYIFDLLSKTNQKRLKAELENINKG